MCMLKGSLIGRFGACIVHVPTIIKRPPHRPSAYVERDIVAREQMVGYLDGAIYDVVL